MQTSHGFECGSIDYIAGEFSGTGLIYHFTENGEEDHVHSFSALLERLVADPEGIEPDVRSGEYSVNELEVIDGVKRAAAFVRTHGRPMTAAELRENRRRSEENIRNEQT